MRAMRRFSSGLLWALMLTSGLWAQNAIPTAPGAAPVVSPGAMDFQYQDNYFNLDQAEKSALLKRIQWKMTVWMNFNYANNSDLRSLDESSETSIELTDDRLYFMVSGAELATFIPVSPRLDVRLDLWKAGFWGHDQLGGRDANNDSRSTYTGANTVNFGLFYLNMHLLTAPTPQRRADLVVGRQEHKIGGQLDRDYLMSDILDAIVLNWHGRFGFLDLLLLDVYSSGSSTQDVYFVQYLSYDSEKVDGFGGDVNTLRSGFTYRYPIYGDSMVGGTHVDGRIFYYAARFGAVNEGGSDRTNEGANGNYADNDVTFMRGLRMNAGVDNWLFVSGTYAESYGIDRKRPDLLVTDIDRNILLINPEAAFVNKDTDTNGRSWALEVKFSFFDKRLEFVPAYFLAEGGRYDYDGTQRSHGFVSFKGNPMGGILTAMHYGGTPSAYVDDDGIDDWPYERRRRTGTEVKSMSLTGGITEKVFLILAWWEFQDTNEAAFYKGTSSLLEQNYRIVKILDKYPEQRTAIEAQRRMGQKVGEEFNLTVEWRIQPTWKAWATAGIFKPGRYYTTKGDVEGAPEGSTPFVGFQAGTKVVF